MLPSKYCSHIGLGYSTILCFKMITDSGFAHRRRIIGRQNVVQRQDVAQPTLLIEFLNLSS